MGRANAVWAVEKSKKRKVGRMAGTNLVSLVGDLWIRHGGRELG